MNAIENEWNLFLLVQQRLDAGAAREVSFDILGPPFWTIFSRRLAQVRGDEGREYELGPDFPEVLHALMRVNIDSSLAHVLPKYRLYFQPGKHHPHYDPARRDEAAALGLGPGVSFTSTSPDALRNFLDRLPPAPPAESENEDNHQDEDDR